MKLKNSNQYQNVITSEAIILRKTPLGEYDAIISLYTREMGRIRAAAKNILKSKNRLSGILNPMSHVHVTLYSKNSQSMFRLNDVEKIHSWKEIKFDLNLLESAYTILEIIERLTPDQEPNLKLFEIVLRSLCHLETYKEIQEWILIQFQIRFLELSGYGIHINQCTRCGKHRQNRAANYSFKICGSICRSCLTVSDNPEILSSKLLNCIDYLNTENAELNHLLPSDIRNELSIFIGKYYEFHLDFTSKSQGIFNPGNRTHIK